MENVIMTNKLVLEVFNPIVRQWRIIRSVACGTHKHQREYENALKYLTKQKEGWQRNIYRDYDMRIVEANLQDHSLLTPVKSGR